MHLWDIVLIGFVLSLTAGLSLPVQSPASASTDHVWEQIRFAEE